MSDTATIPAFPVPELSERDAAFGADRKHYISYRDLPKEFATMRHPMCKVADALFFDGGKLADHGIRFKADVDPKKAMLAIRSLLCSFAPKHEEKIGTVGIALANWCEPVTLEAK